MRTRRRQKALARHALPCRSASSAAWSDHDGWRLFHKLIECGCYEVGCLDCEEAQIVDYDPEWEERAADYALSKDWRDVEYDRDHDPARMTGFVDRRLQRAYDEAAGEARCECPCAWDVCPVTGRKLEGESCSICRPPAPDPVEAPWRSRDARRLGFLATDGWGA